MERNLIKLIKDLNHSFHKLMRGEKPDVDLNMTQLHIVNFLLRHQDEDICQKDLEEEIGLKKSSITGTLVSLEKKKVIKRKTARGDKRKKIIKFTSAAKNKFDRISETMSEIEKQAIAGINEEELDIFFDVLDKITKNVEGIE